MTYQEYIIHQMNQPGLVGYWPFNSNHQGTLQDVTKSHNHGTIIGPIWSGNRGAGALDFDGVDDRVDTEQKFLSTFRSSFSISAWVQPDDGQPANSPHICGYLDSARGRVQMLLNTNGTISIIYFANGQVFKIVTSARALLDGVSDWVYVLAVWEVEANGTVYMDGVNEGEVSTAGVDFTAFNNTQVLTFQIGCIEGTSSEVFSEFWDGLIDEFTIYNRALKPDEIKQQYELGRPFHV